MLCLPEKDDDDDEPECRKQIICKCDQQQQCAVARAFRRQVSAIMAAATAVKLMEAWIKLYKSWRAPPTPQNGCTPRLVDYCEGAGYPLTSQDWCQNCRKKMPDR